MYKSIADHGEVAFAGSGWQEWSPRESQRQRSDLHETSTSGAFLNKQSIKN